VKPVLVTALPQVFIRDMAAACAFYTASLGFSVRYTYGEPPFYAEVARDGVRLNLRCLDAPPIDPALRDARELLTATILVDDIAALFAEYQAAGVSFMQLLLTKPWGARDFIVADLDGNLLLFAGR